MWARGWVTAFFELCQLIISSVPALTAFLNGGFVLGPCEQSAYSNIPLGFHCSSWSRLPLKFITFLLHWNFWPKTSSMLPTGLSFCYLSSVHITRAQENFIYIDGFPNLATPNLKHLLRFSICSKREYINPPNQVVSRISIFSLHHCYLAQSFYTCFIWKRYLSPTTTWDAQDICVSWAFLQNASLAITKALNNPVSVVREKEEFPVTAGLQQRNVFS